jgi:hypothetical protein
MEIICPNCSSVLDKLDPDEKQQEKQQGNEKKKTIITPDRAYKYRCSCYFATDGVQIYDCNGECPDCLDEKDEKTVFPCGHWICDDCFNDYKSISKNCPICRKLYFEYGRINIQRVHLEDTDFSIKDDTTIPEQYKESLKKLYIRVYDFIGKFILDKNFTTHEKTIIGLREYYKWLVLLSENGGATQLSPGSVIDQIWHEHILDLEDYINTCIMLAGKILYHYPENSFSPVSNERDVRWKKTISVYREKYGNMNNMVSIYWNQHVTGEIFQKYITAEPRWHLYVKEIGGKTSTLPFTEDTTFLELQLMIYDYTKVTPCQQRIISGGIQLGGDDDMYLHRDLDVQDGSTLHLVLRLSGC